MTCTFCGRDGHLQHDCPGVHVLALAHLEAEVPVAERASVHPPHVIERILSLSRRDYGASRIVSVLNRDGVPNSRGGPWCRASVRQVLGTLGR